MISEKICFNKLNNTRDLGGMSTLSGKKIIKGKLFRSGHLLFIDDEDLSKLSKMIELVVDFRTARETVERPDPVINGIKSVHLPVLRDLTEGITREKKATSSIITRFMDNPEGAKEYMISVYKGFAYLELPLENYRKFIDLLLEKHEKGILWHCTAGKDRAGFATVIVQEILGVDRDSIKEDYLYTNFCLKEEISKLCLKYKDKLLGAKRSAQETEAFEKSFDCLFGAKEEYFCGVYDKIKELYGDFEGFIHDGLKISDEKVGILRNMYLE